MSEKHQLNATAYVRRSVEDDWLRLRLRRAFLQRIVAIAPEVLESLRRDALPSVEAPEADWMIPLQLWSAKWNLTDDWLLQSAVRTLQRWSRLKNERKRVQADLDALRSNAFREAERARVRAGMDEEMARITDAEESFAPIEQMELIEREWLDFRVDVWRPERELWSTYKKRVLRLVKQQLATHRQSNTNFAELMGWKVAPRLTKPDEDGIPSRIDWLISYQCLGLSAAQVAERYKAGRRPSPKEDHSGRKAAMRAIKMLRDAMGLTLREPSKNQHG